MICANCCQPIEHNGFTFVHSVHDEITTLCFTIEPCFDSSEYLHAWEGIGASKREFDFYHTFILHSTPCWQEATNV